MKINLKSETNLRDGLKGEYITSDIVPNMIKLRSKIEKLIQDELYSIDKNFSISFVDFEYKCNVILNKRDYIRDQKIKELLG